MHMCIYIYVYIHIYIHIHICWESHCSDSAPTVATHCRYIIGFCPKRECNFKVATKTIGYV